MPIQEGKHGFAQQDVISEGHRDVTRVRTTITGLTTG
jgi:hypothetical protein